MKYLGTELPAAPAEPESTPRQGLGTQLALAFQLMRKHLHFHPIKPQHCSVITIIFSSHRDTNILLFKALMDSPRHLYPISLIYRDESDIISWRGQSYNINLNLLHLQDNLNQTNLMAQLLQTDPGRKHPWLLSMSYSYTPHWTEKASPLKGRKIFKTF